MPAIVQALHLWRRPTAFAEECARRYGDCFTLHVPSFPPEIHFSHPDAVREIFTEGERLLAGAANRVVGPLLGWRSLLVLDGVRHMRERRLMMPPFHGERMKAYGEVMRGLAASVIDAWPLGRPVALRDAMMRITLDVILRTVFGLDEGIEMDRLRDLITRLLRIAANPMWLMPWLQRDLGPLSPWGRLVRLRREIHALLQARIVRSRAAGADGREDVLSMLVTARDETGAPMPDEDLRDEMMTLLFAGHETTATAIAWAVHHILGHPPVLARLRAELRRVSDDLHAPEEVARLQYLDAVVKESLRLTPIIPEVGRQLAQPMRIGGWDLPAGVVAVPSIYLTHRRADRWPEPERFLPERFLDVRPTPYEFYPFGGGVRRCLGMAFAMYEMKIVLAELLSRVELRIAPGYRLRIERRSVTLAPSRGLPVVVEARRGSALNIGTE